MISSRYLFLLSCVCLLLDQCSKAWALSHLTTGGIFLWEGLGGLRFSLDLVTNSGAAWGFFASWGPFLVALRILLITAVLFYAVLYVRGRDQIPFALICTGALSNIVDSFLYGHVIDFFHIVLWKIDYPVFNLADSFICVGVLYWFLLRPKRKFKTS